MTLSSNAQPSRRNRAKTPQKHRILAGVRIFGRVSADLLWSRIVCAFLVGGITTGGLVAMLPILRVLINGDTLQSWVDRQIVGPPHRRDVVG